MICQFDWIIKPFGSDFWTCTLEELQKKAAGSVKARTIKFFMPSSEHYCKADDYILWGSYTRDCILDIQRIACKDGSWKYEVVKLENFRIQRIKDKETGKTHALLDEVLIPYRKYSLRYILYHLQQFFSKPCTQESYCLEAEIEPKTFSLWLKWIKDHFTVLSDQGVTQSYRDNWKTMRQWVQNLGEDLSKWTHDSLQKLNLALFQKRKMPGNTMYQKYTRSGRVYPPTDDNFARSVKVLYTSTQ